jgi:hypothetical protein
MHHDMVARPVSPVFPPTEEGVMRRFIRTAIAMLGAVVIGVSGAHALNGATAQESTCEDEHRCSAIHTECRWDVPDRKCEINEWGCQTSVGECPWS